MHLKNHDEILLWKFVIWSILKCFYCLTLISILFVSGYRIKKFYFIKHSKCFGVSVKELCLEEEANEGDVL